MPQPSAADVSGYIAAMLGELTRLADRPDMAMLSYFLGMARIEAESASRRRDPTLQNGSH